MAATYTVAIFLSVLLLFMVEPMFAKMAMPSLGGSPAVWATAIVFYQSALLAGYIYAHGAIAWLGERRQAVLHVFVLLLPLLVLPLAIPAGWLAPTSANPAPWMLGLMAITVGLPFSVLSASSPMLQKWFSRTNHRAAADPYFLYAASNAGSIIGLLAYPFVLEPLLGLRQQSLMWAAGYGLFVLVTLGCAVLLWRVRSLPTVPGNNLATPAAAPVTGTASGQAVISPLRRLRWVVLAFVPSSLMLSVTTYFGTRIAPFPLLWVIPLAIYLLTFVLVFSPRNILRPIWMIRLLPILTLPLVITLTISSAWPDWLILPLHLLTFFVIAMVCHRALADDRPPATDLTEFYLWMSVGGALGGVFNSLLAPVLFSSVLEYPIVLVLACVVVPATVIAANKRRAQALDVALPVGLGLVCAALALVLTLAHVEPPLLRLGLVVLPAALVCYGFSRRPLRFGLGVAAIIIVAMPFVNSVGQPILFQERSFFGINTVRLDEGRDLNLLSHGDTLHGLQSRDPARQCQPLGYYTPGGPAGQVIASMQGPALKNVAVVGLGAGGLATYAKPGQAWIFYEIDASVQRIATNGRYFTFLSNCAPQAQVVMGDARLSLVNARPAQFDLLMLDAYSSDSVPVHLITREAMSLYVQKLAPHGLLAFHISNRYFDLKPILGALSQDAGLIARVRLDTDLSPEEKQQGKVGSEWAVMGRTADDLGSLGNDPRWQPLPASGRLWTDDFSSILWAIR